MLCISRIRAVRSDAPDVFFITDGNRSASLAYIRSITSTIMKMHGPKNKLSSTCFTQLNVRHQGAISVHAADSILSCIYGVWLE